MVEKIFSQVKHQNGYEKPKDDLVLMCPMKINSSVETGDADCIKSKCAWWMPQQRACAVNVSARVYGYVQNNHKS